MILDFKKWLETYGSNGAIHPAKQRPDKEIERISPDGGAVPRYDTEPLPGNKKPMKKKMKKR